MSSIISSKINTSCSKVKSSWFNKSSQKRMSFKTLKRLSLSLTWTNSFLIWKFIIMSLYALSILFVFTQYFLSIVWDSIALINISTLENVFRSRKTQRHEFRCHDVNNSFHSIMTTITFEWILYRQRWTKQTTMRFLWIRLQKSNNEFVSFSTLSIFVSFNEWKIVKRKSNLNHDWRKCVDSNIWKNSIDRN